MSEPLAQRAVTHAFSSLKNSLVHFLRQSPLTWPFRFPYAFAEFARCCRGKEQGTWTIDNNNQVVKALRQLREEQPQHISDLIRRAESFIFTSVKKFLCAFDCYYNEHIDCPPLDDILCLDNT
jgi:hypothetical protein